jgi:hypothetical protein
VGLRSALYGIVANENGMLQGPRSLLRRLNHTLGMPLASEEELVRREVSAEKLANLRRAGGSAEPVMRIQIQAPVLVYFEGDRNVKEKQRIVELLEGEKLTFQLLDVQHDEAMRAFVVNKSGVDLDKLPVVFVAEHPIGTFPALVDANVSGTLRKLAFPE